MTTNAKFLLHLFNELNAIPTIKNIENYIGGLNYNNVIQSYPPCDVFMTFKGDKENEMAVREISNYEWQIDIALSGFDKDDIRIEVNKDTRILTVIADKDKTNDESSKEDNKKYLLKRIAYRKIEAKYSIPFNRIKDYQAELKNGLLSIRVIPEKERSVELIEIQ